MHETEFQGNWVIEVQLFLMTSNSSIAGQRSMHGLSPIAQLTTILILLQSIFVRPINAKKFRRHQHAEAMTRDHKFLIQFFSYK